MSRIAYVNGHYVPHRDAAVHIEDRAYQFADGVYEVCEVRAGRLIDERRHMERLKRSLRELRIAEPMGEASLGVVLREVARRNRIRDGIVYLQVSRGVAPRNHGFPDPAVRPAVVVTARRLDIAAAERRAAKGVAVVTVPETRWARVDIKSVSLLPNVLAKQAATEAGAFEAWFVDADGLVTEGSSSNAWIVTAEDVLVTAPADLGVLRGVTRTLVVEVAARLGLAFQERRYSLKEALAAKEAFMTSATSLVTPIVKVDGQMIGDGRAGALSRALRFHSRDAAERGGELSSPRMAVLTKD
jgi:D-alanine transaminase